MNQFVYDKSLVASAGLSFLESAMSQFHDQREEISPQDGRRRLGAEGSQADHGRDDLFREAEASQRDRWFRFLARQIARDILRQSSVKEDYKQC